MDLRLPPTVVPGVVRVTAPEHVCESTELRHNRSQFWDTIRQFETSGSKSLGSNDGPVVADEFPICIGS